MLNYEPPISDAKGRLLFRKAKEKAQEQGKSPTVAFAWAWAAVAKAGYVEGPGGVWCPYEAQGADLAALVARIDELTKGKGYNPSQPRDGQGRWTGYAMGVGGAVAAEGLAAPQLGTAPYTFMVKNPTAPTDVADNDNPEDVAVYVAGIDPGEGLNGTAFGGWDAPTTDEGWAKVAGQADIGEPPMPQIKGKRPGSGVIVEEPDGRIWVVEPTNHFGGYEHTFPKGGLEKGMSAQANAIKETWEEAGLKVKITGYLGDYERTTSVARMYTARRTGGSPALHGNESQAVKLVPKAEIADYANHKVEAPIIADYLALSEVAIKAMQTASRLDGLVAKSKGWKKQLRAPQGTPIGGQWIAYGGAGGGALGTALAQAGMPLKLQAVEGKNPDHPSLKKAQAQTELFQAKANAGDVQWFNDLEAVGKAPKPAKQTYAAKAYDQYVEAKAYAKAKAAGEMGITPATPKAPKPKPKGAVGGQPESNISDLKKVGEKPGGSAAGGLYEDSSGQKWLVKAYKDDGQAQQEVLAAGLYKAAGADAPEMKLVDVGDTFGGTSSVGVMSKWEENAKPFKADPIQKFQAQKDFAADAWLGNWDAVGLNNDNIVMTGALGDKAMRIDPGGSLEYRAMGAKKGKAWNKAADEWDTLRDPKVNKQAAAVFGGMPDAHLKDSAAKLAQVDDATIKALTAKHLPKAQANKMADTLIARRDAILKKSGLDVEHAKAPGKLTKTGTNPAAAAIDAPAGGKLPPPPELTKFYNGKVQQISDALAAGDLDKAQKLASYKPKSAKAANGGNFVEFTVWSNKAVNQAKAKAADTPIGPKSKPVAGPKSPSKVGPAPEAFKVTSAANMGQQKKFDQIHDLGKKGDVDGLMAMSYGTNTYGKQQAKKANEWLVHHGYQPVAFGGMNGKTDPNKGLHSANLSVLSATFKPAKSQAESIKAATAAKKPTFKPEQISDPEMDFENWGGSGKGLSGVPEVNKANNAAIKHIHETAKKGSISGLDAITFDEISKETKLPTGNKLSYAQHPSAHVKGYFEQVKAEIDYQRHPPPTGQVTRGSLWHGLDKGATPYTGKLDDASVKEAGNYKIGNLVVLADQGVVPPEALEGLKTFKPTTATYAGASKKAFGTMSKSAQQAIQSYTGPGYKSMNSSLWKGNPSGAATSANSALKTKGVDLSPGTMLSRKVTLGDTDRAKLKQSVGSTLQEPAISSTSVTPDTWYGNVHYKMTVGEGVKGLFVGKGTGISHHAGENEVILPANTRMHIQRVIPATKSADADGFGGGGLDLVEVLILPSS